jgi:hypothetical protein
VVEVVLLTTAVLLAQAPSEEVSPPASSYIFAQTQRVDVGSGRTAVSAETQTPSPRHGYFPLRLFIDNSLGPRQQVKVGFNPLSNGGRPMSKTVEVLEGERRTVVLALPHVARYGTVTARAPGITQVSDPHIYFNEVYAPQLPLLSLGSTDDFERWVGHPPAHTTGDLSVLSMPLSDAPTELAAYSGYDAVAVPGEPFENLSEAQRRALEAYAATGGTLVLGKASRALESALPLLKGPPQRDQPYGLGRLVVCDGCQVKLASFFEAHPEPVSPRVGQPDRNRYRYDSAGDGKGQFVALLPQATAPIGRFLVIIALFTLAIGPGSIWIARRRGPAALLLTIPFTAFVTCSAIIGYSLTQDGFTIHGSTRGMTLLDSRNHRALQVGLTAYYANLSPGSAHFSQLVTVVPPAEGSTELYAPGIDWTENASMGSDFVPSRTYREWGFVSAEATRARVGIRREAKGWVVQNALGSRISALVFMADDALWRVENVRDGAEGVATKGQGELPSLDAVVQDRFSKPIRSRLESPLKEGEFLARIEGQGFTPSGGLSLNHHESSGLVRGEVEHGTAGKKGAHE